MLEPHAQFWRKRQARTMKFAPLAHLVPLSFLMDEMLWNAAQVVILQIDWSVNGQ
jgi:hypothetical protein